MIFGYAVRLILTPRFTMGRPPKIVPLVSLLILTTVMFLPTMVAETSAGPLFAAAFLSFDAGAGAAAVAMGDLNADGKPDLAVANSGCSTVSVLLGNGDGTLGANTHVGTGAGACSVEIGDLTADGEPDLAVAKCGA